MSRSAAVLFALLLAEGVTARGASPYLPLHLAPEIERQIESVLLLAGKPVLKRPIAAATVLDALPSACEIDAVLCGNVRAYLKKYMQSFAVVEASGEFAVSEDRLAPLPNRHGLTSDSEWAASAQVLWQPVDHFLIALGASGNAEDVTPTGSVVSAGWDFAQLDVGYRDHWFSPLSSSAMLVSSNAATFPSVTLSNYEPFTKLGFTYEIFLGELSTSDRIFYQGDFTTGKPRLSGLHVAIEPVPGFALSANRLVQFGGGPRGGTSLGDFIDALVKPYASDNTVDPALLDEEFGNQQAAFTSEFVFPGRTPFSVYFEYAGEDTSYDSDYRLGNSALSAGIRFPSLWKFVDVVYEASDWQNGWYVNGIYQDGTTNEGRVIGHWAADHRFIADAVGAQSHFFGLGWAPPFGGLLNFSYRTVRNESYSFQGYERAYMVGVEYARPVAGFTVGGSAIVGEDAFGESFGRLAGFARFGDEWAGGGDRLSHQYRDPTAELFVDAGVNLTELRVIEGVTSPSKQVDYGREIGWNIGIGVRRAVNIRSDLGARVDLMQVHDEYLLGLRAVDYRYRLNQRFSVNAFLGAARMDLATAAYGYYLGAGAQWRNVLPQLDAAVEFRFADRVARDKLVSSDLPATARPDIFYDVYSAVVSLSYRW